MTDKDKVGAIQKICTLLQVKPSDVIYLGDGQTDYEAFSYVHENGGTSILVGDTKNAQWQADEIIDYCFAADFREGSALDQYIASRCSIK